VFYETKQQFLITITISYGILVILFSFTFYKSETEVFLSDVVDLIHRALRMFVVFLELSTFGSFKNVLMVEPRGAGFIGNLARMYWSVFVKTLT
jgi:hypothetical protein